LKIRQKRGKVYLHSMDPHTEFPSKERVVVTPELATRIDEVARGVEAGMDNPEAEVATAAGQMSMLAELGKLGKETAGKRAAILFKDAKAVLGVLPFINKVSEINSARIAKQPINEASRKLSPTGRSFQEIEQDVIKARENSVLTKVHEAAGAESVTAATSKDVSQRKKDLDRAIANHEKALAKGNAKGIEKATKALQEKEAAWIQSSTLHQDAMSRRMSTRDVATQALDGIGMPKDPWKADLIRKAGIHTDAQYKVAYERIKTTYEKKGKKLSDGDIFQHIANGETPVFTKTEKFGRGVKKVGMHILLQNLGPIINPVPDVPEVVTLVSYGAEVFGGQWWAGLVPPLWQFAHNRYEDVKMSYETSQKALEIVKRHWNKKYDTLKDPKVARAAEVFAPTPAKAAV
jgi:hypothetical protein